MCRFDKIYNSQFLRAVNNEKMTTFMQDIFLSEITNFPICYTHSTAHVEFHPDPKDNRFDERIMNYDFHLFHTMPYSWFSQACSIHVVLVYSCFHKLYTCTLLVVLAYSIPMAYSWISQAPNAALEKSIQQHTAGALNPG